MDRVAQLEVAQDDLLRDLANSLICTILYLAKAE